MSKKKNGKKNGNKETLLSFLNDVKKDGHNANKILDINTVHVGEESKGATIISMSAKKPTQETITVKSAMPRVVDGKNRVGAREFIDELNSKGNDPEIAFAMNDDGKKVSIRNAANEILTLPQLENCRATLVHTYDGASEYYSKYLPGNDQVVFSKNVDAYRKIWAVLSEGLAADSIFADRIASIYNDMVDDILEKNAKQIIRDFSEKELPSEQGGGTRYFLRMEKAFLRYICVPIMFFTKYASLLYVPELLWMRVVLKTLIDEESREGRLGVLGMIIHLGRKDGEPEEDKVYLSKEFNQNKYLAEYLQIISRELSDITESLTEVVSVSSTSTFDSFSQIKVSGNFCDTPEDYIHEKLAVSAMRLSNLGIDFRNLVFCYPFSQKELRNIVAKASLLTKRGFDIQGKGETHSALPEYISMLSSNIVESVCMELITRAHLNTINSSNDDIEKTAEISAEDVTKPFREKIDTLEAEIDAFERKQSDLESKLSERGRRVSEQEKIIKKLEKELKEAKKIQNSIDSTPKSPNDAAVEDVLLPKEVNPLDSMTETEIEEYVDIIQRDVNIYVYGLREGMKKKIEERFPKIRCMDPERATANNISNADLAILRTDYISHPTYIKLKEQVKKANIPYRHMSKGENSEWELYKTIIDMYEHN